MVLSGKDCPQQAGVEEVATATLDCFRRTIPAAVPGIVFLSGGQSAVQATEHLNAMKTRAAGIPGSSASHTDGRCKGRFWRLGRGRRPTCPPPRSSSSSAPDATARRVTANTPSIWNKPLEALR
ncbi:Probable fructose-bisphosphate aldolase class 1 [Geodia barretti]|nr:Probable fructose-bisphosphate aldolase class 1 [Geodia barretti]